MRRMPWKETLPMDERVKCHPRTRLHHGISMIKLDPDRRRSLVEALRFGAALAGSANVSARSVDDSAGVPRVTLVGPRPGAMSRHDCVRMSRARC
jgi:hypothetical protein